MIFFYFPAAHAQEDDPFLNQASELERVLEGFEDPPPDLKKKGPDGSRQAAQEPSGGGGPDDLDAVLDGFEDNLTDPVESKETEPPEKPSIWRRSRAYISTRTRCNFLNNI